MDYHTHKYGNDYCDGLEYGYLHGDECLDIHAHQYIYGYRNSNPDFDHFQYFHLHWNECVDRYTYDHRNSDQHNNIDRYEYSLKHTYE
jgi:hypothetical protein